MNLISSTYRFIALTMALLLFTSSVGFSIDIHYCQGELKSLSFLGEAESCHDRREAVSTEKGCSAHQKKNAQKKGCSAHQKIGQENKKCSIAEKDCCENKTMYFQANLDEQVKASIFVDNASLEYFVAAFVSTFVANDFSIESEMASYSNYKPPLIARDIPVLIESFLL